MQFNKIHNLLYHIVYISASVFFIFYSIITKKNASAYNKKSIPYCRDAFSSYK